MENKNIREEKNYKKVGNKITDKAIEIFIGIISGIIMFASIVNLFFYM